MFKNECKYLIMLKKDGFSRLIKYCKYFHTTMCDKQQVSPKLQRNEYLKAIQDLNSLQSNTQTLALAKYKKPEEILPLFAKQLQLAGIEINELDKLNVIHVTGTKGKGSTCAFVESILRYCGEKTGFYNSPHLLKVTERIRIEGKPIDDEKFSKHFRYIYDRLDYETKQHGITMPSYFSFLTILSFHIFLDEKVDCAIIEVGIGGEYDPTNIVQNPIACGITTLDYDHTNILGKTLTDIATAKAGIIKRGVPLFTVPQEKGYVIDIIKSKAIELGSDFHICKPLNKLKNFQLGIQGQAQNSNAALACQLAYYFVKKLRLNKCQSIKELSDKELVTDLTSLPNQFQQALKDCYWSGRCQIIDYPRIVFYLDGAHTRKSMLNCLDWYLNTSINNDSNPRMILMLNVIGDRDKKDVMEPLAKFNGFEEVIFSTNRIATTTSSINGNPKNDSFTTFQADKSVDNVHNNAQTWKLLLGDIEKVGKKVDPKTIIMTNTTDSMKHLVDLSNSNPNEKYHVLVTGSLHFVGAILETIIKFEDELL